MQICGSILQLLKGGVRLKRLAQSLSSLYPDVVVVEAVSKGAHEASAVSKGIDSKEVWKAAYLSNVRVPFLARPSERYLAASALRLFLSKLRRWQNKGRQRCVRGY